MKNYFKQTSIQTILSIIVFTIITLIMGASLLYDYNYTQNKLEKKLEESSKLTTKRVALSIAHFIETYQINEYEKLIQIELQNDDVIAIIIEDYVTGKILGNKIYQTGRIKSDFKKIEKLKQNKNNQKILDKAFLILEEDVFSSDDRKIGKVNIYFTDYFVKKELNTLIFAGSFLTILISLLMIVLIYFAVKRLLLNPIINLANELGSNKENLKIISREQNFKELSILYRSIKNYSKNLEEKNEELELANHEIKNIFANYKLEKKKYESMLIYASDGIFLMDKNGKLLEFSKQAMKLLGYKKEQMQELNIYDWDKELTKERYQELFTQLEKAPIEIERVHKRKDGSSYIASITASKIKVGINEFIYASARDITKEKQLQDLVLSQKEEFEMIFNYALDGISITDLEGNFKNFNEAFRLLTGFERKELLKKNCNELTASEDKERNKKAIEITINKGHVENFEKVCVMKDDKRVTVNVSISLLPDEKSLLFMVKDTSTLKLLEQQTRLASMGEMIGNIAHQWRQPLSMISTSASGLRMQAECGLEVKEEQLIEFSEIIVQQTKYLSQTIDNFRDFVKGEVKYSNISIKSVLENTLSLVEASLKNNHINVIKDIRTHKEIFGSVNELNEAFINIINNSKDILKEKVEDEEKRFIVITCKELNNEYIEICFKDSGGGIKDELVEKIFDPYFTTKHKSLGTGLGLSMADKIIRQRHEGFIEVVNEEFEVNNKFYKGACFKIKLKTSS